MECHFTHLIFKTDCEKLGWQTESEGYGQTLPKWRKNLFVIYTIFQDERTSKVTKCLKLRVLSKNGFHNLICNKSQIICNNFEKVNLIF